MKLTDILTIERLAIKYGILMALAPVGFFLLMKAFGLHHNLELRALNIVILSIFVLIAVKDYDALKTLQCPTSRVQE